ncbi:MAG TPA: Ig-like domain-containing protein, partial [Thermoanaerobaculia bacterium]
MSKTAKKTLLLIALLTSVSAFAQTSVRDLVPSSAPAGARVMVTGRGLADPALAVAFATGASAAVVQRHDRYIEVVVPANAASGNVRITNGATLVAELPFTVTTTPKYIVSTHSGGKSSKNTPLKHPWGAAVVLPEGTVAVADEQHHRILLVTAAGPTTVLAGGNKQGFTNGKGAAAEFNNPRGITFDAARRVLYVSDSGNSAIREVALDGTVKTLAGSGKQGFADGTGAAAEFRDPHGLTVGADGAIYVTDPKNFRIRRVTTAGAVTTFAGNGQRGTAVGDGALLAATFNEPRGIVVAGNDFYVADTKNNAIRRISGGQVTSVLSFPRTGDDDDPAESGDGNAKVLNRPAGIGVDESGFLIVSDSENDFIRRIDPRTTPATMVTIAGTGKNGWVDGDGAVAQFKDPVGLTVAGAIYVADEDNDALRRLCPEVRVTGLYSPSGAVTAGTEVRLFGTGFVPGLTTVQIGGVAATSVTWITSTELSVNLPQNITGGSVSVTIVSCAGTAGPVSFVVDNTAPVITVTQGGTPLVNGALFRVPVTPVIAVTDDIDPAPRVTITLNGAPFVSGTTVSVDAFYTLVVTAEDAAGNRAEQTVKFVVLTAPASLVILEGTAPLHPDSLFNRAVVLDTAFTGFLDPTVVMQLDGQPYTAKTPYSVEGTHSVTARATDSVGGDLTAGPIAFTIDLTPPVLTFTSHTNNQVLSSRDITVIGGSDDAVTVSVNGIAATVDTAARTFTLPFTLNEGENTLVATGTDRAGNTGTATLKLRLDTRAPELTVAEVAACVRAESLELRGTVADPALDKVVVKLDGTTTNAVVTGGAWSATIALPTEGSKSILVEATDSTGHVATEQVTVTVDRTAPQIELSESGGAFTATLVPRPVALFVRSNETSATITATLGTTAYTSGTEIAAEGSHTIRVTARDCAGNESSREHTFAIDLTPPRFLTFTPASGTKVSTLPGSLSGTVSDDAVEVRVRGITVPATNGAFTIPNIGFTDGVNELALEVVDRAGHTGRGSYTIGIRTSQPLVDIVEGGEAMVNGTVYRRTVEPRVRVFEDGVNFTATLNGAPFTNGTTVSENGQYTISATATDPAFNQSSSITRTFTIDRSGPEVVILSPADGASINADRTDVRVTAGDSVRVVINTVAATKGSDNVWTANVPLEIGENVIVATGTDAAGNSGSDSADVTRGTAGPAIVLTFPPDNHVTNRPRLDVTGRVLRPNSSVAVTVPPSGAASAAVDPAGMFRLSGADLQEGEWTITAVATEGGKTTSAAVRVIADFTPPRVRILESGSPLADSAHFPTRAVITGDATDKGQPVNYTLVVDGNTVTNGVTISATGGHTAVITATDAAGNQARLERTFYVGSSAGGGCLLEVESFDPRDGTVLNAQKVELIGRSGGAAGVKANGVAAKMSNGSFCVPVELPQEGANTVTIVCTDAAGNPTGEPKVITLYRATNDPSITITTPAEDSVSQDETIVVTGTLSNGAISVDVNGKPATINGSNWTVTDVRLQDGVNVLVAHAKNASGRAASASRRVTYLQELPAIAISSPIAGFVTGRSRTDVSGTFSNVVPTSIAVTGVAGAVTPEAWSDTTGRFVGRDVPLQTGDNTVVVTGLDRTGRIARAEVVVRYTPNLPLIDITSPADNHYYGGAQGNTFRVEGTFTAAAGSSVDVNGVAATISGNTFSADIPFSNLPGGLTPVIARVAQPSGDDGAFDSLRVFKLAEAPKVLSVFPPANEIEVNPGAVVLVLFSAAMERASTVDAFRLENSAGTALGGKVYLDKDVLTFAPGTTLTAGERYTIKVAGSAKDLAGQSLTPAHESSFVVATTAPGTAPTLTTKSGAYCGNTIDVAGTATPGARLRLDYGQVFFTTTATPTGTFTYKIPLSGQQGFHVIRVRTMGGDGTLSPFVELKLNVDCAGPRVLGATYDRNVNTLTIVFNRDVKTETVNATTVLLERADGTPAGGPIVATGANAVVTPSPSLFESTFTLKVTTGVQDTAGRNLEIPHTQLFPFGDEQPQPGDGRGYITGEVYDATTGRPLAGAAITIEAPAAAFARGIATNATAATQAVTMITDARGRYSDRFPEGAHTIKASANGYTTVWRQIIVPAGAGVIPIDIRLTRRGTSLVHGGDKVARRAELTLAGTGTATITSTGAQSLAGLLPLGWSPLASAVISTSDTITGHLTFDVPQSELTQHAQSLTAVRYDDSRDEWRVLVPVVNVNSNKATFDVSGAGAYALVYADRAPKLKTPPAPVTGAVLQGAVDPCATGTCPELIATSFPLDPAVVLPSESTVATLNIRGTDPHLFPSGTAVQAYIDEELRLVDGGRELDPPFATDLLLYRNLAGDLGVAAFNLAPSPRAAEVTLEVGFDHIRILPYPGRLDRGTLVGPEGGRVPADEKVSVEIPTGATQAELRATATSIADAQSLGPVAGFTIVGGLNLSLQQAATTPDLDGDGKPDAPARVELTRPARATFSLTAQQAALGTQFVLVELLDQTPFGQRVFRLAAEMQSLDATRWTTKSIDREQLPVDGIIREGRYLLLAANAPVAFAKGIVRLGAGGPAAADARVTTPTLGVADLSRLTGIFNVVVPATPATPFQLTPRSATLGDGASYTHTSSPAANAIVNVGDLLIVAQPPQIASTIPAANATNVNPATTVEVTLTPGIDATSVNATTLSVIDTTTGTTVAGTVTAVGNLAVRWTMPSGNSLRAGTRYTVAVAPSLRGTNGTPLGQAHTFSFTTASVVTSNELHPERIHITIPDANGLSRITGLAGALKTGWLAVPVRRNRDFFTRYSVVANADGSFALTIGTDPRDRLTIADEIDLRVLNNAGALAALFPLTPFVSEDGKAFVVSKGRAATFTSADNITITVPEGAFDKATLVEVRPSSPSVFAAVPRIATELLIGASIEVRFDGRALKPLELSFPTPAGTDPNLPFFLAILGQSSRGPRLQAVDTLVSANGKLSTGSQRGATVTNIRTNNVSTNEIVRSNDPRDFLMRFIEAGQYAAAQMRPDHGTMAWSLLNTAATVHELHWDTLHSMYVGHEFMAESLGRVAFPVPAGTKYTVTAIDPTSSLIAFEHTYDALPVGPPGTGAIISAPNTDFNGPHPVYATPFRVESVEAPPAGNTLQALRDVELALDTAKNLTISGTGSMTAATWVSALNVNSGEQRGPTPLPITLPNTSPGDRIILTIDEKDVDPASEVSVVFNESIEIDGATSEEISDELKTHVDFVQEDEAGGPDIDLLQYATLRLDASGRRIIVNLGAPLARGADFRLTLKETIHDRSGNGLNLGQTGEQNSSGGVSPTGPASQPMTLRFKTRDAHGEMGRFTLRQRDGAEFGAVREIAQYDNLMFVAALDGGILAYDLSDPGALNDTPTGGTASQAKPIAIAPGRDSESYNPITDYWSLQIDHHGRIFSVGTTNMFGAFRSFRVEDFVKASTQTSGGCLPTMPNTVCKQSGGAIISQLPGTSYTNGLPSQVVTTDRAEATPRKIKVVVGDAEPVEYTRDTIVSAFGSSSTAVGTAGLHQFNLQIPASGTMYRLQRITIENVTLGLRWSADAKAASTSIELTPAKFEKILAGPNDVLRVTHNRTTHAVITLFGFGIGVFDVNAIESNELPQFSGGGEQPLEQVALRRQASDGPA